MEHPVREIPGVFAALVKGEQYDQEKALKSYFLPNASFTHRFGQREALSKETKPITTGTETLWIAIAVYRWYRALSPHLDITVDSSEFDKQSCLLYVSLRQTFSIWFFPIYKAPVRFVSVLQLTQCHETVSDTGGGWPDYSPKPRRPGTDRVKYFIASQEDLYPVTDWMRLLLPGVGPMLSFAWWVFSLWLFVVGSVVFLPLHLAKRLNIQSKVKFY